MFSYKKPIIFAFIIVCLLSIYFALQLKVNFEFRQFFPEGDDDLEFFNTFTKDFEKDDNTLLVSIKNNGKSIFDTSFLQKVHDLTFSLRELPFIIRTQSITNTKYPIKTPFGYNALSIVHINDAEQLQRDKDNLLTDERFIGTLISKDGLATNIVLKTEDDISLENAVQLISSLKSLMTSKGFSENEYNILGKTFFQSEIVRSQKREILISTIISSILVSIIIYLIFGSIYSVMISMTGIGCSLLIFMGFLGMIGRELSVMAALYPVLILIVGSSDVIHLMYAYIDAVQDDSDKIQVMKKVLSEIGFATFLTSITTAFGFFSLITSKLVVLREFGINAAIGVMIAFFSVIVIIPLLLISFNKSQLYKPRGKFVLLDKLAMSMYGISKNNPKRVTIIFFISLAICVIGMIKVTTNYNILNNLPRGEKVTNDFLYFEKNYAGFRPLEFAITVKPSYKADDFEIVKEVDKIENYLRTTGYINSIVSQATIYKSLEMANNGNQKSFYKMPDSLATFENYKGLIQKMKGIEGNILINKDKTKTRITSIVADIGADSIKALGAKIDKWILANTDQSKISVRRTGTGLILDKNSEYVKDSLLKGLLISIIIISLFMAYLVKDIKMLFIAMIPNFMPLFFASGLLGYFNIPLEAGISIIFAVIFGIAVDDTIHFLTRYKICIENGDNGEEAILNTFQDTGKSIILTTVILFFGFLVMLFSNNPTSFTVGLLISFTLISALICDLLILPILIRKFLIKS